ncbi:hypothetical protein GBA63_04095 [Rubrobacter tropicus]|uniref:Uncharacterized protein n=1 Tax=Rubrobacter tropicus TaxID=2653851 RepID=A0A6G8Q636_9ACTN|nr:hypothetical protein [Rubrobacter tropicus]QIN81913.1 hypothetical protein GBA63_04095 [Rubrobacter tropicus]
MFGRKSRAEKLKEQAQGNSFIPAAALSAAYAGARPVAERLLYDDDLRDNIRVFIESARTILDELSGEDPTEIVGRLWDDDKLRKQVEAAAGAAQEGTKRVRGQRVKQGGGGRGFLFLLLVAGVAFLFLNPKTGPSARNFAKQAYGSITGD